MDVGGPGVKEEVPDRGARSERDGIYSMRSREVDIPGFDQ
jgi:hypothetical protein